MLQAYAVGVQSYRHGHAATASQAPASRRDSAEI